MDVFVLSFESSFVGCIANAYLVHKHVNSFSDAGHNSWLQLPLLFPGLISIPQCLNCAWSSHEASLVEFASCHVFSLLYSAWIYLKFLFSQKCSDARFQHGLL